MLTIKQEINRLERVLNGGTVVGLKLGDKGIEYKWVIERIANLRAMEKREAEKSASLAELHRERNCDCHGTLLTEPAVDPLDSLVETILDVALEERHDEAAITIRDLIYKYAKRRER